MAASATGYLRGIAQYTRSNTQGPLPTRDLPEALGLFELTTLVKRPLFSESHGFLLDISFFFQRGAFYYADVGGERTRVAEHAVPALRPRVLANEAYLSFGPHENLSILVGRKRLSWGSGQAYNPMDLLNPPKDLTDPSSERAGAWLVRLEAPFETWTASLVFAPAATRAENGIPYNVLFHPAYDGQDRQPHFLAAARLYALVADADISLVYFYGNLYGDAFDHKSRVGLSFSRSFFGDSEVHLEALVQRGSARAYAAPACVESEDAFARCLRSGAAPLATSRLDDDRLSPTVLLGARSMFPDESLLSVEYVYQAAGYTRAELSDFVAALYGMGRLSSGAALVAEPQDGQPRKLVRALLRKHHAFLSWQKPRIRDDFTFSAVALLDLHDLSGLASARLRWSAREWLDVGAGVSVPWGGVASLGTLARGPIQGGLTSFELLPLAARVQLGVTAYY